MWWVLLIVDIRLFVVVPGLLFVLGAARGLAHVFHGLRFARAARAAGLKFDRDATGAVERLRNQGSSMAASRACHLATGSRNGMSFAVFDFRGPRGGVVTSWSGVDLTYLLGPTYFTAIVVDAQLPAAARRAATARGLRPWHAEFGPGSSVLWRDGLHAPGDVLAAVDALVGTLRSSSPAA